MQKITLFKKGQLVTYDSGFQKKNGMVQRDQKPEENFAVVVYHCAGNWNDIDNYTAQRTPINKLSPVWI